MAKILVGMSGGVDSAVAALELVRAGHEVAGAYMKNWINEEAIAAHCPWQEDIEDARAVAQVLGIGFEVANFMRDYRERVVAYLIEGYRRGITPNPDVMCNREMKFGVFLDYARERGFEAVATGHYARRVERPDGTCELWEGADKNKDQSYFLALLSQQQLRAARFPLGGLTKPAVREKARAAGLPNADKKDSQGICFIGQVQINDFLEHFIEDRPGEIVTPEGEVLGEHRGLHRYTLGQRKGIGIPSNTDHEHYVVVAKDGATNRLTVAFESARPPELHQTRMRVQGLSWVTEAVASRREVLVKPRYRDPSTPAFFVPDEARSGWATLEFREPQRALAPGQICALYEGERLLGGGVYG